MPANGGTVSNLYAETNNTLTGSATATVAVIDNTSGIKLLSCEVKAGSKGVCSNTATAPESAAAGDRLEVKVTTTPPPVPRHGVLHQGVAGQVPLLTINR